MDLDRATSQKNGLDWHLVIPFTAAARDKLHVHRGIMRTINLVEKPGDFLKDQKFRWTVLGYMLRGRKRNARAPHPTGPKRAAMLQHLDAFQPSPRRQVFTQGERGPHSWHRSFKVAEFNIASATNSFSRMIDTTENPV
ncbi:MAG: hypothetical protein CM15mP120_00700 [Pseudomonadota bacterium]|nr:MAG: hypothetical protein CM15mP120_00700 [Pseudomonadota bacterium]